MRGHRTLCILLFPGLEQRKEFHLPGWLSMDVEERQGDEAVIGLLNISSNSTSIDYVFLHCWTLGMMSKTAYPLMLVFSSLSTDYNYFNHSCYQSGITVHICQKLLCNKSELSYYIKQS